MWSQCVITVAGRRVQVSTPSPGGSDDGEQVEQPHWAHRDDTLTIAINHDVGEAKNRAVVVLVVDVGKQVV